MGYYTIMAPLKITEVSHILDVSIDTIRNWHKKGLIKATKDTQGNRLFDPQEVSRVLNRRQATNDHQFQILKTNPDKRFTCIDLFAGAGGTALGLENAGFDHVLVNEIDPIACSTLRTNRPQWSVIEDSVSNLSFKEYRHGVDLIEGGFPCQAFSYAGKGKGFGDTRGTLFFEFARAIREAMPKAFMGENVRGLLRHDSGRTLETMLSELHQIKDDNGVGYKVSYQLLKSQYFDVPQKRERLIIIGIREDVVSDFTFPKENDYLIPLSAAIVDVPEGEGQKYPEKKRNIMELIPPGGYWSALPDDLQRSYMGASYFHTGGRTGMARRLAWDEPSLTLTCSPSQKQTERCHPEKTRPLNVREYARIQTFPDNWTFEGSTSAKYKQIGNAVPVNLAFHIGNQLHKTLLENSLSKV